jgi:fused signal recognition particle receptor
MGILHAIQRGLTKTRQSLLNELQTILGKGKLTEDQLDQLEENLIRADAGVETAFALVDALREQALGQSLSLDAARAILRDAGAKLLLEPSKPDIKKGQLHVILIIGVNGSGKTTTIGKLASHYHKQGLKVLLAAADTFRAAAIDQLEIWAKRTNSEFVHHQEGSDPAAVAFDAYQAAVARSCDILLIDTAGRLHNKELLMDELKKVARVIKKNGEHLPHETLLVLDGNTGQNMLPQVKAFHKAIPLTGLIVTKLDGTAKGGAVMNISGQLKLPVQWLGMGEAVDDLVPFSREEYLNGLFSSTLDASDA